MAHLKVRCAGDHLAKKGDWLVDINALAIEDPPYTARDGYCHALGPHNALRTLIWRLALHLDAVHSHDHIAYGNLA